MSELISITAIRDPQSLSPKEIDKIGIKTHPDCLHSERYEHWLNLCENKEYEQLYSAMGDFLIGNESIKSYDQISKGFQSIIKFSEYNGFKDFTVSDFAKQVDIKNLVNEFGNEIKEKGCYNHESPFFNLITNLNDQLLAITQFDWTVKHEFVLPQAIKSLLLFQSIYLNGKEKIQINIEKHFAKPLILNSCIIEIDPCSLLPKNANKESYIINKNNPSTTNPKDTNTNSESGTQEKKCKCEKEKDEDCECKCNDECVEQNPCCAKIIPYVAELFVVRDEVCKYEPGEISYIENVMESEIKVRKHSYLQREETFTEQEEDINTFEEKDLQVEEQFSLNKEIDKIVEQSLSVDAGATYSNNSSIGFTKGGLTIGASKNFSANLNSSYNWSKKEARKQVQNESKNVISKAISRVEKKIRTLSTKKLLREIIEKNKHVFGGTTGAEKDISRQILHVNKVKKAQVFSYGKRAMLDFYVPETSELLKRLIEKQFDLKKPVKPCINIEDIGTTKSDWLEYVQCYGFSELEQPKEQPKGYWHNIPTYKKNPDGKHWSETDTIQVPNGYTATKIALSVSKLDHRRFRGYHYRLRITCAGGMVEKSEGWGSGRSYQTLNDNCSGRGAITLTMIGLELDKFEANVSIWMEPDLVDNLPFQLDVHSLLMKKYEDEIADYYSALSEYEKSKENHFNKNPFILSEMMKEQLKHAAISYITCQFFDDNDAMKNKVEPCGFPQMDIPESKREGEFVRFIEQAFEWKFMNYTLYPYFWARKCSWEDKFQEESDNYLFTKFLQSGYARISISIRPGFESMVNYYLKTRRIWNGSEPPIMGDAFVPIHQEIKESNDNFNADRNGYLSWDSSLNKNEIKLFDNLDYYTEDIDPVTGNGLGTYSFDLDKIVVDVNRELTINCVTYRIINIAEFDPITNTVKLTLDRDLEIDCCCSGNGKDFGEIYKNKELPWSTGAEFISDPWKFNVPTSLTWLREESGCLPCYPIDCKE